MAADWNEEAFEREFPTFDDDGSQDGMELQQRRVGCPYCGEPIEILLDASVPEQEYIEDCSVCCRPITVVTTDTGSGAPEVALYTSDDVF